MIFKGKDREIMKKKMTVFAGVMAVSALFAAPEITNCSSEVNAASHVVTITYDLSEDAVITPAVFVGSTEMDASVTRSMAGAVHRLVKAGTGKKIYWKPELASTDALVVSGQAQVKLYAWKDDTPDYMIVDGIAKENVRYYVSTNALPLGSDLTDDLYKSEKLVMRKIIAKDIKWPMGLTASDATQSGYEHAPHYVTLTTNYYLGIYELTIAQFQNLINSDRKFHAVTSEVGVVRGKFRPANAISHSDLRQKGVYYWPTDGHAVAADSFIGILRAHTGIDFDLPTEAQWEYACRAGEPGELYSGETWSEANVNKLGWSTSNNAEDPHHYMLAGRHMPHEVGLKLPNRWGLYDMLGNAHEHCLDVMSNANTSDEDKAMNDPYNGADTVDPVGPTSGTWVTLEGRHARRGSGCTSGYGRLNPHHRFNINFAAAGELSSYCDMGVRLACPAGVQ